MDCMCWWVLLLILCLGTVPLAAQQQRPLDVVDTDQAPNVLYYNTANTSEGSQFQRNLDTVFEFLQRVNPPNGFATSLGYGDFPDTAYGHTACYNIPDQPSCQSCIQQAYADLRARFRVGARLWTNNTSSGCNMRYENANFTRELPQETLGVLGPNASLPVPPPAGQGGGGSGGSSNTSAIVGGVVGSLVLISGIVALFFFFRRRRFQPRRSHSLELQRSTRGPVVFSYRDLCAATEDFSERNKVGQGGFGTVHKATLGDGTLLAVKSLSVGSQQGKKEFVNEISIITSIRHRNLVRLEGYCAEGNHRLLVYEFLEKGSVDQALFGRQRSLSLNWQARFQIIVGVAKGLAYLHEESHVEIIHRDIKASNILLDKTLQPKISDFGISKLAGVENESTATIVAGTVARGENEPTTTRVAGTVGYMAPEYVLRGRLSSKADVFSFGVLVLEIISGRRCMDDTRPLDEEILVQWAWSLFAAGKLEELIDPRLEKAYVAEEAHRATHIALLCSQEFEGSRPTMSVVVAMLMGYLELEPLSTLDTPSYFGQIRQHGLRTRTTSSSQTGWASSQTPLTVMSGR